MTRNSAAAGAGGMAEDPYKVLGVKEGTPGDELAKVINRKKLLYKTEGEFEPRATASETPARIGEATVLRGGSDLTIAAYSIMTMRALEAAESRNSASRAAGDSQVLSHEGEISQTSVAVMPLER